MSTTAPTEALALPCLSRHDVVRSNRLHARRAPLPVGAWRLRSEGNGAPFDPVTFQLRLPWGKLRVGCASELLDAIVGSLQPGLRATALAPDLLPLLIEQAFDQPIAAWNGAFDLELVVQGQDDGSPAPRTEVTLTFDGFGHSWPVVLGGDAELLETVLRQWPTQPAELAGLPLGAALRLASTRLTTAIVASLRAGDVLLFERAHGVLPKGLVVVSGCWAAPVTLSTQGWRMDASFAPLRAEEKVWMGSDDKHRIATAVADPDGIPVTLGFDLGEIELPIGDLRRLAAGSILEMPRPGEAPVRVTANGRPVGTGELVRVEGRIGVKLLRIFDHG